MHPIYFIYLLPLCFKRLPTLKVGREAGFVGHLALFSPCRHAAPVRMTRLGDLALASGHHYGSGIHYGLVRFGFVCGSMCQGMVEVCEGAPLARGRQDTFLHITRRNANGTVDVLGYGMVW